ncbi:hypothetical protein GKQ38_00135 [Candidatus Nanohaloarchaea archaeon]|nr:hypothetical protein GKQ38_00135 [Candidatus Nanohaloarchaea archaeon]
MKRDKALLVLTLLTVTVFAVKAFPVFSASTVPPGWVDTSYHTSTALDVSRGDLDSLMQPWWHIQGNSEMVQGLPVIDRNSKTFYYPPFLHVFIAGFMLFLPTGLATIISVSLIYSLAVPATYLLSRSYKLGREASLLGAGIAGASIPLLHSQLMGFWSFATAFIFGIASFSLYRLYRRNRERKYLAGYIFAGLASVLTHWVFGAFIIGMPLFDTILERKQLDWKIPGLALAVMLPNYIAFFATSSIGSYITTSFEKFYPSISPVIVIAGIGLSREKYRTIDIFSAGSLTGAVLYYLGAPIPFGGMIQFALPLLAGFYTASIYSSTDMEELRKAFTVLAAIFIAASFFAQASIGSGAPRAVSEEQFQDLIDARSKVGDKIVVPAEGVDTWVTLASGENRIMNPYAQYNASELDSDVFYTLFSEQEGIS